MYGTESYSYLAILNQGKDGSFIDTLRHLTAKERNRLKNIEKKATDLSFKILSAENDDYPEKEVNELVQIMIKMIVFGLSGSPTKSLVKDHFIQLCIAGWIASFFVIIYL